MFCKKCGTKLMNGVSVCHACGANVNADGSVRVLNTGNNNPNEQHNYERISSYEVKKENKISMGLILVLAIILIIAVIFLIKVLG